MTIRKNYDSKRPHVFNTQEALLYGVEKAIILYNISELPKGTDKKEMYKYFPYWKKEEFEGYLNELIADGILIEEPF